MDEKKKIGYTIALVLLLIIIVVGATYAYFSATAKSDNDIKGGTLDVSLGLSVKKVSATGSKSENLIPIYDGTISGYASQLETAAQSKYNCIDKKEFKVRMCAYYGWLKHADAKNLLYKIQSLTGVRYSNWNGKRTNITKYYGKYVRIIQIINYAKYFRINFIRNGKAYYADSRDKTLFYSIHRFNHFPINFKIIKYDWRIYAKNRKEKVKLKT